MKLKNYYSGLFERDLITSSIWVGTGAILTGLFSYFFIVMVAKTYTLSEFGDFGVNLATLQILGTIATLGVDRGLVKYFPNPYKVNQRKYLLTLLLLLNVSLSLIFIICTLFIIHDLRFLILLPYSLLFSYSRMVGSLFIVYKKPNYYFYFNIMDQLLRILVFSFLANSSIKYFSAELSTILSLFVINVIFTVILFRTKIISFYFPKRRSFQLISKIYKYSAPLFITLSLGVLFERLPIILTKYYWSSEQSGLYNASLKIVLLLSIIPTAINYLTPQRFIEINNKRYYNQTNLFISRIIVFNSVANFFACSVFFIFSKYLLHLIGKNFLQANNILEILIVYQFFASLLYVVDSILTVSDKPYYSTINQALIILSFFLSLLFLKGNFGFVSVGYSLIVSIILSNIFKLILLKKMFAFKFTNA